MSEQVQLDREQLKRLDQESLIELILDLQQQLAAQQELIQLNAIDAIYNALLDQPFIPATI